MVNFNYLYNPDIARKSFEKNYFVDKKLGFSVIENGTILPHKSFVIHGRSNFGLGGIVDSEGNFIESSSLHYGTGGAYTPPPADIQHSSETVIYLGFFYRIWGHDLTDNIRRVWFFKSAIFKSEFKNCPIVYVPYKDGKFTIETQPSLKRLLEILEINVDELRPITQPTRFERIILPDDSFSSPHNPNTGFTAEYREMIDHVRDFALKNRTPISAKNIYFFYGKKGIGEERLAEYLKSKGYNIVYSKQREDVDEELNLLINCDSFVSTVGSCSHNSLFLRDGTEMILIPRAYSQFRYYQEIINQIHPLNINYVDSSLSIFSRDIVSGAYCFIISEQLKRFFGDKFNGYEEDDFKTSLQYFKDSMDSGRVFTQKIAEYYSSILPDFIEQLKQRGDLIATYNMPYDWETFQPSLPEGLTYQTHVSKTGWSAWNSETQISNPLDQKLDIQAIKLNYVSHKIYYSVYYNDKEGWSKEVLAPEQAGIVGKRKPIFGIRIRLDEAGTKEFDILYRMHKFDDTWTPWAKNGEALYSYGFKLNALQIKLRPVISYQTHVHLRGWRDGWKSENQISNPLDQMLDVLAIRLNLPGSFYKAYYSVYFNEFEGWSKAVLAPEQAGTVGKHKPILGMKIWLNEAGTKEFDILYRMHKFDGKWTPWAKNGEVLYSHGVKLNAIQVKLVLKADEAEA